MNILYIHQYFKTPQEPGGTRSYWIAQELIKNGHSVTMLTSKSNMNTNSEVRVVDGIEVVYLNVRYDNKMSLFQRATSFLKFMFLSTYFAFKQKDLDLVISTSTPLTVGLPALLLRKFRKIPYVFEVRDLWPEVPIVMGAIKNKQLIKLSYQFEKLIYSNAAHIIALSPGMRDGVVKAGVHPQKISMIPNMSKIDEFWPRQKNISLMRSFGLNECSFKIVHFGALGKANGAMSIIETAKVLKNVDCFDFIFLGGGATELELRRVCESEGLRNVHFLGTFPMHLTSEIVNLCDVSIVSFLDLPILYTNSPNKLFDSLSAGKPIIVNSAGWTKELVEKHNCGLFVDPLNAEDLASKLYWLKNNPNNVKEMGIASRKLAENTFDKSILCNQVVQLINSLNLKDV